MSSGRKGFMILEALIAVLITGVIVMVVTSAVILYENSRDGTKRKQEAMQEKYTHAVRGIEVCQNCEPTADPYS